MGLVLARMSSQADGPRDDEGSMTSVAQLMLPIARVEEIDGADVGAYLARDELDGAVEHFGQGMGSLKVRGCVFVCLLMIRPAS